MTTAREERSPDDSGIEELLREVGARAEPAPDTMREVHAAVHAEWLSVVSERRHRRRSVLLGMTAGFVLVVVAATFGLRYVTVDAAPVGSVTLIDGRLLTATGDDRWNAGVIGDPVAIGETIRTDDRSRAAMRFGSVSLRLDRATTVQIVGNDRIMLASGALYLDSPPGSPPTPLTVQAHEVSVRHAGTQYQVRTHANALEVSVREGRVTISNAAGTSSGVAGERIRVTAQGEITRAAISPRDPAWRWAASVAPAFEIDNQPLAALLTWIARESGREVIYASQQARAAAADVRMRGSVAGLDLDTALNAVLATTQLRRYQTSDEFIGIALADGD